MKNFALWLKVGILFFAAVGVLGTLGMHFYYEHQVRDLTTQISNINRDYLLKSKELADAQTKGLEDEKGQFQHEADTFLEIFTHAASVFGGLAFSALIDLTGLNVARNDGTHV